MTKYSVTVHRTTVEWALVDIEASNEVAAGIMAVEKVKNDVTAVEWDWDSSEFAPGDVEDLDAFEEDNAA